MRHARLSRPLLVAAAALALSACGRNEPEPATPPSTPATESTPAPATPAQAPIATPTTPANNAATTPGGGAVTLGNAIDANNRIATPLTTFSTGDTIHASVATDAAATSRLTAKWTHLDSNQTVAEETKDVAAGAQATDFHISKPDGWPTGRYRVEISQDGNVIGTSEFDVQ
jgi:hypothetical protein